MHTTVGTASVQDNLYDPGGELRHKGPSQEVFPVTTLPVRESQQELALALLKARGAKLIDVYTEEEAILPPVPTPSMLNDARLHDNVSSGSVPSPIAAGHQLQALSSAEHTTHGPPTSFTDSNMFVNVPVESDDSDCYVNTEPIRVGTDCSGM